MRRIAFCALAALTLAAAGPIDDWEPLDGDGIVAALQGRVVEYESAWQDFRASGRTLYNAGSDSWGYWHVQGDRYCSQWPPNALWACYAVEQRGTEVRFIGAHGDISRGALRHE